VQQAIRTVDHGDCPPDELTVARAIWERLMSGLPLEELESVAAAYERLLVPALLQQWTPLVVDAAGLRAGQRVLDVACGTGILARAAAARVGSGGSVAGLDINPGMLAVAARTAPWIEWREGTAESLPYEDSSFDAAMSQFGLMFFTDRHAALREMLRVLVPGGRLAVAVFDTLENVPAYAAVAAILERLVGNETGDVLRYPFVLGEKRQLASLFAAADVNSAAITSHRASARFASVTDMILADVNGWFPLAGIKLEESTLRALIAEAEAALEPFVTSDRAVEFPVSVHIVAVAKA
jgi:SAM-dependent methyltransferase